MKYAIVVFIIFIIIPLQTGANDIYQSTSDVFKATLEEARKEYRENSNSQKSTSPSKSILDELNLVNKSPLEQLYLKNITVNCSQKKDTFSIKIHNGNSRGRIVDIVVSLHPSTMRKHFLKLGNDYNDTDGLARVSFTHLSIASLNTSQLQNIPTPPQAEGKFSECRVVSAQGFQ